MRAHAVAVAGPRTGNGPLRPRCAYLVTPPIPKRHRVHL